MMYLDACGWFYECTEEEYRAILQKIATGATFYYDDHARQCDEPPAGSKIVEIDKVSKEQAQQMIGGG